MLDTLQLAQPFPVRLVLAHLFESALTQRAVEAALRGASTQRWVEEVRRRPARVLTAEVLSALARLRRPGLLGPDAQVQAMEEALALPQELVLPTARHQHRALALQDRIRVLDGLYIALAEERVCALVTTDRRLSRAVAGCDIRTPPPE